MKKYISIILTLLLIQSSFLVSVDVSASSAISSPDTNIGGGSGGGGGGSSRPSITVPVTTPVAEYTVGGTIYLPAGIVAPKGGLKIYGGFGGVSLSEVATASTFSTGNYVEEDIGIQYENYEVIATIPEGQNYVTYSATCEVFASCDGIYGKFWVYDNVVSGNLALSNKQTLSNIIQIKANIYEYTTLNCIFNSSTIKTSYAISCDDILSTENISTDVYVIADDGYDKYISYANILSSSNATNGILNLESDAQYTLYYYIPSSSDVNLQKIDKGLFNVGALNINGTNTITVTSQYYVAGTISIPDNYIASDDITINICTSENDATVILPKGETSIEYIIGAFSDNSEHLEIVVDDEHLVSGFLTPEGTFEEYETELWYKDTLSSVENFDITLKEQYIINGHISLPSDVEMEENTAFKIYITAKNQLSGYSVRETFYMYSDDIHTEYKIFIPKEKCVDVNDGEWTICYDYGTYTNVSVPTSAETPLKPIKKASAGGGGGGGSVAPYVYKDGVRYHLENPSGLMYDYRFYLNEKKVSFIEDNAFTYNFNDKTIKKDFVLAGENDDIEGIITGYFKNVLEYEVYTHIEIQLYDDLNNLIKKKYISDNAGYYFDDLIRTSYKLGIKYNDEQYYYQNKKLVKSIDDAEIISLAKIPVKTHIDTFFDNIYDAKIKINFGDIIINDYYQDVHEVKILDKYGNVQNTSDTYSSVTINFSPFCLKIGDYFVSEYIEEKPFTITHLVDSFDKAFLFNAQYYDSISMNFYKMSGNRFIVNAYTELYNTPLTNTTFCLVDNDISFSLTASSIPDGATIIVAVYDENNKLVDINTETYNEGQVIYELAMTYQQEMSKAKIMVWDSLSPLRPMGMSEELYLPSNMIYDSFAKNISDVYLSSGKTTMYFHKKVYIKKRDGLFVGFLV